MCSRRRDASLNHDGTNFTSIADSIRAEDIRSRSTFFSLCGVGKGSALGDWKYNGIDVRVLVENFSISPYYEDPWELQRMESGGLQQRKGEEETGTQEIRKLGGVWSASGIQPQITYETQ